MIPKQSRKNRRNSTPILGQSQVKMCFIKQTLALKTRQRAIMIIICSVNFTIKYQTKPRSPTAIHSLLVARRRPTRTNPLSPSSCLNWQPRSPLHLAAMPATATSNDFTPSKVRANSQLRLRHNGSVGALVDKFHSLPNKYTHTLNR